MERFPTSTENRNNRGDIGPKSPTLHVQGHTGCDSAPMSEVQNEEFQEKGNLSARVVKESELRKM